MSDPLLDDFELHLRLCPDCLSDGNNLCPEARYLADDFRAAHRPSAPARRRRSYFPFPLPTVRIPGVLA